MNRLGEATQPIDAGHEDVVPSAVLQIDGRHPAQDAYPT